MHFSNTLQQHTAATHYSNTLQQHTTATHYSNTLCNTLRGLSTWVGVSCTECEAALAELKANDTDEGKAAYAKLLAETQPVLDILDDVLGED